MSNAISPRFMLLAVAVFLAPLLFVLLSGSRNATTSTPPPSPLAAETRAVVSATGKAWVFDRALQRHTCPSATCGAVGEIYVRQVVDVVEVVAGWGRITERYDASCTNGRSDYVDSGEAACAASNGIVDQKFAEWVPLSGLTAVRPEDPRVGESGLAKLVSGSDDFDLYRAQFISASEQAMSAGYCTKDEISGGWMKSQNQKAAPVYFLLCGRGRVYTDMGSGRVWEQ